MSGGICNLKNWRLLTTGACGLIQPVAKGASGAPTFAAEKKSDGIIGVKAKDVAWTLFARATENGIALTDGGYAYFGAVNFGKAPKRILVDIVDTEPDVQLEFVDITEFAPSTPLAKIWTNKGERAAALTFEVKDYRNVVLMVKGGSCTIGGWRVLP